MSYRGIPIADIVAELRAGGNDRPSRIVKCMNSTQMIDDFDLANIIDELQAPAQPQILTIKLDPSSVLEIIRAAKAEIEASDGK